VGVKEQTVEEFLSAVAAATPTPGGGSVAALAGALSVALSRMVAGLARGKIGYEAVQDDLARIEERAVPIQERLRLLVDEDSASYQLVVSAMRMPKTTEGEKAARVEAMQAAYRQATKVPLETVERGVEAIELAKEAAEKGNRSAFTDCGVAVLLAEAAIRGASLNVRVNLASIRDESFRSSVEEKLDALLARAQSLGHDAMAIIERRL
jgi:formiminotetrahydrofolate cyclodeaminase